MKPNVELHIEELVLDGFAPTDRTRMGEIVERELTRLFAEQGAPPSLVQGREDACLDGGTFEMNPGSRAEVTGVRVAQAVYGGLSR